MQITSGREGELQVIIIDEYQDISRQRFDLARALSQICDAKIIAVGDDWQSIYAYAGSDITLFTHFAEIMGYGEELKITKTYRNSQEVIDIAGSFIQKNSSQIQKSLISPKHIDFPIIIEAYSEDGDKKDLEGKGGKFYLQAQAVERCIGQIIEENEKEGKPATSQAAYFPSSSVTVVRTAISLLGRKTTHPSLVARTINPIRAAATGKST